MAFSYFTTLALLSLRALNAFAQIEVRPIFHAPSPPTLRKHPLIGKLQIEEVEDIEEPSTSQSLAVKVSTSFPSSEIFGIKLINGHPTQALLSITNDEPEPVTVVFIGGSLWASDLSAKGPQILRNLTTTRYNVEIPAGIKESISYSFTTELLPQDLKLNLAAVITDIEGTAYTLQAFNETVSIVEPDTSIFDPQMLVLLSLFTCSDCI